MLCRLSLSSSSSLTGLTGTRLHHPRTSSGSNRRQPIGFPWFVAHGLLKFLCRAPGRVLLFLTSTFESNALRVIVPESQGHSIHENRSSPLIRYHPSVLWTGTTVGYQTTQPTEEAFSILVATCGQIDGFHLYSPWNWEATFGIGMSREWQRHEIRSLRPAFHSWNSCRRTLRFEGSPIYGSPVHRTHPTDSRLLSLLVSCCPKIE